MVCTCNGPSPTSRMGPVWSPSDPTKPVPSHPERADSLYRPDIFALIETTIRALSLQLKELSLDIHSHPELKFEERHAHDTLTEFMAKYGFEVTKHCHFETGWKAEFQHGVGGRTVGVNSEMDALPGIGHACGHNLIAISGVGIAIAIKAALQQFNINGKVVLLGTPAEEGGSGKVLMLRKDAYKGMDICLMSHPSPGPIGSVSLSSCLALERLIVEYTGHTAHAALSPWEGRNALDAAVLGYNNISALRQQLPPTHRVHGIIEGKDWAANIIPDHAKMICYVRAPTQVELQASLKRVRPCFEAAALATGCEMKISVPFPGTFDLRQNKTLGEEVVRVITSRYGSIDYVWGISSASTDFGNVTYELPALHPGYAIPTIKDGGNHTLAFTKAAASDDAHQACLNVTIALAATGVRVLIDDEFFAQVRKDFEEDVASRAGSAC